MSALTSFRRGLRRGAGTQRRIIGYHTGFMGMPSRFPKYRGLRSWAIYRNHGDGAPWMLIEGFDKEGTKPGHRRARRLLRNRHGWSNRNRSHGIRR